jgi:hypothetical protein
MEEKTMDTPTNKVSFDPNTETGVDVQLSVASSSSSGQPASSEEQMERLRDKLTQAKIDLSAEKTVRKRKEKNLVKLAKELNRRASESDLMSTTLAEKEEEIKAKDKRIEELKREMEEDEKRYRVFRKENEKRCEEYEDTVQTLRKKLLESSLEVDRLNAKIVTLQQATHQQTQSAREEVVSRSIDKPALQGGNEKGVIGFLGLLVVIVTLSVLAVRQVSLMDGLCSPLRPGTVLTDDVPVAAEAPWWAPDAFKSQAWRTVCGAARPRTTLTWNGDKLEVSSSGTGGNWQKRAPAGVRVDADKITIRNKKGQIEFQAPWSTKLDATLPKMW